VFRVRCDWFRLSAEPNCFIQAHYGPAYDVKFYGDGEDALLLRFKSLLNSVFFSVFLLVLSSHDEPHQDNFLFGHYKSMAFVFAVDCFLFST